MVCWLLLFLYVVDIVMVVCLAGSVGFFLLCSVVGRVCLFGSGYLWM